MVVNNTSPAMSPTVVKQKCREDTMSWGEACAAVLQGQKITKLEWQDSDYYGVLHDNKLYLHRSDTGQLHPWIVSDGDMAGEDWVILDSEKADC